jgi:predicted transcriptional regulator
VTSPSDDLFRFIGSSFRSVWALELLLLLKGDDRGWSRDALITALRASELVVNKALEELLAAGLISIEKDKAV